MSALVLFDRTILQDPAIVNIEEILAVQWDNETEQCLIIFKDGDELHCTRLTDYDADDPELLSLQIIDTNIKIAIAKNDASEIDALEREGIA